MAVGEAIVSVQAAAIGITAIPTPETEDDSDLWFFLARMYNSGITENRGQYSVVDSKAMRKVDDGQDLVTVVETGGNSNGAIISGYLRTLIKLH